MYTRPLNSLSTESQEKRSEGSEAIRGRRAVPRR